MRRSTHIERGTWRRRAWKLGRSVFAVVALALLVAVPAGSRADEKPLRMLICQPGGPSLSDDEQGVIGEYLRYLEGKLALTEGRLQGRYYNTRKDCLAAVTDNAAFFLMPVSVYAELEKTLPLEALAQVKFAGKVSDKFHMVVAKDQAGASLESLKGKTITGTTLEDPEFVARVVLKGALGSAGELKLKPKGLGLRAIKAVIKGKADAALLDGSQYRGLDGTPFGKKLARVYESEEIPNPMMVVAPSRLPKGMGAKTAEVLLAMGKDRKGREVLETFQIEGFVAPQKPAWAAIVKRLREGG